jgi:predicted nuclease of predicted toxin-antitoxin system
MSIKLLVDMNLSPDWVPVLVRQGWPAVHWSTVGDPRATDRTIMDWAVANGHVVFTHDLDFGTALALAHATGPSVLQVRSQDVLPDHMEGLVVAALRQHKADLASGALVVVDESKSRVRILPIR